ncbi:putative peptidase A22A, presenilin [Helianthus debilis subsp. tardiflorus]
MFPVSICMLLVILLVNSLTFFNSPSLEPIRTTADLVYLEAPSDSTSQKIEGSLLNALVFVILIAVLPAKSRGVEFNNMQTSGVSICVHTMIYFGVITILLVAIGISITIG